VFSSAFPLTFKDPRSIFPRPCRKPTTFKHSEKQQLEALGECCKLPQRGLGAAPPIKAFLAYMQTRKWTWWQQLWLFSSAETCPFEAKNCHPHHCPVNSRTFQDRGHFPGLPRDGNFTINIPGLFRGVETLLLVLIVFCYPTRKQLQHDRIHHAGPGHRLALLTDCGCVVDLNVNLLFVTFLYLLYTNTTQFKLTDELTCWRLLDYLNVAKLLSH